jgi:flagellin
MASFGDYNRVNTNVTAMDAQLSLNKINRDLGDSRLKLSTGFKINNAEDDAAGFAIATKLKSRVAGLEQALQNVSDAKSVLGVVEGAYGSIMDNLIEMKTLTTQAANETLSHTERGYIGTQIEALADDINSVAASASFNGVQLLDGTSGYEGNKDFVFQVGEGTSDTQTVTLNSVNVKSLFSNQANGVDQKLGAATNTTYTDSAITELTGGSLFTDNGTHEGHITVATPAAGNAIFMDEGTSRGKLYVDTESTYVSDTNGPANATDYRSFMLYVDEAISKMNSNMNSVGIEQRSLSGKEVNLTEAITANSAARSRIMDTDFAKEQSNSIRLQILQQTATAALSQANMGPQAVLGFLG